MKHFTNTEKINGEMAVRSMSAKAQRGYNETDPMEVYQTEDGLWIKDADGITGPMTAEQAEATLEYIGGTVVNSWGVEVDFDAAVALMDDEIREQLHAEMAPCSNQAFFEAYAEAHEEKFGEEWGCDTQNPVM